MARLPYPDRKTFPQELQDFLAQVPEHLPRGNDQMPYTRRISEADAFDSGYPNSSPAPVRYLDVDIHAATAYTKLAPAA